MRHWKRSRRTVVAAVALALLGLGASGAADAHPRGRGRVVVYGGGFYGFNPWFGMGFGPYWGWGPYYPGFYPPGGVDLNAAMIAVASTIASQRAAASRASSALSRAAIGIGAGAAAS
jgi:hypothetical protein